MAERPASPPSERQMVGALRAWFHAAARALPWRTPLSPSSTHLGPLRNPYHALVAEFMLQQTQVSRVLEKFAAFIERFPTPADLARAPEEQVLAAWSGLGYYRRARLLQSAARAMVERHDAAVPADLDALLDLPGIGRYTAGAIASIVFGSPAPIVDGNVARVLLRIHGREETPAQAADWLWDRAADLAQAAAREPDPRYAVAQTNEALMELGATICTPRAPRCDECPLGPSGLGACRAQQLGIQDRIPRAKTPARQTELYLDAFIARDTKARILIERRPSTGLWAGLHQAPTLECPAPRTPADLAREFALAAPPSKLGSFTHQMTHRVARFTVWQVDHDDAQILRRARPGSTFIAPAEIPALALSNPQRRILIDFAADTLFTPSRPAKPAAAGRTPPRSAKPRRSPRGSTRAKD